MSDTLHHYPYSSGCGIVNLNTANQAGNHWICYYRRTTEFILIRTVR